MTYELSEEQSHILRNLFQHIRPIHTTFPNLAKRHIDCYEQRKDCFPVVATSNRLCPSRCIFSMKGYGLPDIIESLFYQNNGTLRNLPSFHTPILCFITGGPGSGKSSLRDWFKEYTFGDRSLLHTKALKLLSQFKNNVINKRDDLAGDNGVIDIDVDKIFLRSIKSSLAASTHDKELSQKIYNYPRYIADQISDLIFYRALSCKTHITMEAPAINGSYFENIARTARTNNYKVIVMHMDIDAETCIERAKQRQRNTGQESAPDDEIRKKTIDAKSSSQDFVNKDLLLQFSNYKKVDKNYHHASNLKLEAMY